MMSTSSAYYTYTSVINVLSGPLNLQLACRIYVLGPSYLHIEFTSEPDIKTIFLIGRKIIIQEVLPFSYISIWCLLMAVIAKFLSLLGLHTIHASVFLIT